MQRRWTPEEAWSWYQQQPWRCGCNFIPKYAGNTVEFWREDRFDPEEIDRELGIAAQWGFNFMRVYLQFAVYRRIPETFLREVDQFLEIADRYGIRILFVLFDDCAALKPEYMKIWSSDGLGNQPYGKKLESYFLQPDYDACLEPLPGVHNSMWVPCPGAALAEDPEVYPMLQNYVRDILGRFGQDPRVLMWDLYNEPYNGGRGPASDRLIRDAFAWCRECDPIQPLTVCVGFSHLGADELAKKYSDILSFHCYDELPLTGQRVHAMSIWDRPVICTEWMARTRNNSIATHLKFFREHNIWCTNWGFMDGRTQTKYPWGCRDPKEALPLWFHDLVQQDGTPYDPRELQAVRECFARTHNTNAED